MQKIMSHLLSMGSHPFDGQGVSLYPSPVLVFLLSLTEQNVNGLNSKFVLLLVCINTYG